MSALPPPVLTPSVSTIAASQANLPRPRVLPWALYPLYMALAAGDVLLTTVTLHLGGSELNMLAARAIELGGTAGLALLKALSVVLVIAICEVLWRRSRPAGVRMAEWAVAISAIPVVVTLAQLAALAGVPVGDESFLRVALNSVRF